MSPEAPEILSPAAATSGLRVHEEWVRAIFGDSIGSAGLYVADLDGSGDPKIVASARAGWATYWYVLSYSEGGYQQEWVSSPYAAGISAIRTMDLDDEPGAEIVVASGEQVFVYDGATRALLHSVRTKARSIVSPHLTDIDGDGDLEIVFCDIDFETFNGSRLAIYDFTSGHKEIEAEELSCARVAVGNVDGDPDLEIVLTSEDPPDYVLDGATQLVEWIYEPGFGWDLGVGDVDGDGVEEIVANAGSVTIYDADRRAIAWEIPTSRGITSLDLVDVEGDGMLDIVFGTEGRELLHVWDPRVRLRKWWTENPEPGVAGLAVGDTDGDGRNELLWAGGNGSTGPDYFYVLDTETRELEWQSQDLRGPFRALDFGDVDDDGEPEILYGSWSSDSFYGDGLFFIHDARSKALEYESGPPTGDDWLGIRRIRHADVDGDPQSEIFVTTSHAYTGVLIAYDGITRSEQWRWEEPQGEAIYSLEQADIDADGEIELVVGGEGNLYVLHGGTGVEEWRRTGLEGPLGVLRLTDIDDDPNLEIVVASGGGRLLSYDGVTRAQELDAAVPHFPRALEIVDRGGDGSPEILVATFNWETSTGTVTSLNPATGATDEILGPFDEELNALEAIDLTEDGFPDLVLAFDREVVVYDGRFPDEELWSSGLIGDGVGSSDSLRVADIDEDGRLEILVNVGEMGLRTYQVEGPGPEVPTGPYVESPELPGFRFKVRITSGEKEVAGSHESDCIAGTVCVSGALPGRSELFLRPIGPRPNGFLWMNLVRFTPSRVEVWAEQIDSGWVNYYELPALPRADVELAGLVDKEAFPPEGAAAPALASVRPRPVGAPGVVTSPPGGHSGNGPALSPRGATLSSEAFPGYRFRIRVESGGEEQAVRLEDDCLPETVCVSGALPGRSELFLRIVGPRPNGFLWTNLVRFTTSRVEVEIERIATGQTRSYVLEEVPRGSDRLPGRVDREAFLP